MTTQEVATLVAGVGVPYAYREFTKATAVPPPFICFFFDGSENFDADDKVLTHIETLIIELYTDSKYFQLEESIESILDDASLPWEKQETYIGSEQLHETIYTLDIDIQPSNPTPVTT